MHISGYAQGASRRSKEEINADTEDETVYVKNTDVEKSERSTFNGMYQAIKYDDNIVLVKINNVTVDDIHVTYLCTVVENVKGKCNIGDTIIIHLICETRPYSWEKNKDNFMYLCFKEEPLINYKNANKEWEIINSHGYDHDIGRRALERIKKDFPHLTTGIP